MANILITGGAGFIGLNVTVELVKNNHKIIIVDDLKNSYVSHIKSVINKHPNNITFFKGDVCNATFMDGIFKDFKIDYVIHLAAKKYVAESIKYPNAYKHNNITSLQTILQLSEKYKIKKFAFASTSVVYGNPTQNPFVETDKLEPLNPYAQSKVMGENLIAEWHKKTKIKTIIFRFTNPVGANTEYMIGDHSKLKKMQLIPYVVSSALKNQTITLRGNTFNTPDGTPIRSFIHITDLAKSVCLTMENFNDTFEIFNIGNTQLELSTKQIVLAVQDVLNKPINFTFTKANAQENAKIACNCTKFEKSFNYKNNKTLPDIVLTQTQFEKFTSENFK